MANTTYFQISEIKKFKKLEKLHEIKGKLYDKRDVIRDVRMYIDCVKKSSSVKKIDVVNELGAYFQVYIYFDIKNEIQNNKRLEILGVKKIDELFHKIQRYNELTEILGNKNTFKGYLRLSKHF